MAPILQDLFAGQAGEWSHKDLFSTAFFFGFIVVPPSTIVIYPMGVYELYHESKKR